MTPSSRPCLAAALLAVWLLAACAAKVEKGAYQIGLEGLADPSASNSYQDLETALQNIEAGLESNPADAQLGLLKAAVLLRQIQLRKDEPEVWRQKATPVAETLQRVLQLVETSPDSPDFISPRAWISAGDLLVLRAEAKGEAEADASADLLRKLVSELHRTALADAASHFQGRATQLIQDLGRNASPRALRQQGHAFDGWYQARLRVASGWSSLRLLPPGEASLADLWRVRSAEAAIPGEFQIQRGVASLDPEVHRQLADNATLALRMSDSQKNALKLSFEAFRETAVAQFFQDPGEPQPLSPRFLNDLGGELAAALTEWTISPAPPPSPAGLDVRVSRPRRPWNSFAPPIRELTVRMGDASVRLELAPPSDDATRSPPRVPPQGLTIEIRAGLGTSRCVDPAGDGTCLVFRAYLGPRATLAPLAGATVLELEDGFGHRKAAVFHQPPSPPSPAEIADRLADFRTHVRRRGFDQSEARRMLWEVADLCSRSLGAARHGCLVSVARGFARLSPADQRLRQPVRQLLSDAHALALSFQNAAERAEALLAEIQFDLDLGLAGAAELPASTESKLALTREALGLLPPDQAAAFTYRLNALEAEFRQSR